MLGINNIVVNTQKQDSYICNTVVSIIGEKGLKTDKQIEKENRLLLDKLAVDTEYQKFIDELDDVKRLAHIIFLRRETNKSKKNDEPKLEKLELLEKELETKVYAIIDNYKKELGI